MSHSDLDFAGVVNLLKTFSRLTTEENTPPEPQKKTQQKNTKTTFFESLIQRAARICWDTALHRGAFLPVTAAISVMMISKRGHVSSRFSLDVLFLTYLQSGE